MTEKRTTQPCFFSHTALTRISLSALLGLAPGSGLYAATHPPLATQSKASLNHPAQPALHATSNVHHAASPYSVQNSKPQTTPAHQPATTAKKAKKAQQPPQAVLQQVNFHDADIHGVISIMASMMHKNFVIDPRVQGKISLVSSHPMRVDEAYQAFLSMLHVLNYTVVPSEGADKIVPVVDARGDALPLSNTGHPGSGNAMVVRVVQLHHMPAESLIPTLRPMMDPDSSLNAYQGSNALIMAGQAGNITHILHVIQSLDRNSDAAIDIVALKHANATQLQEAIGLLQAQNQGQGKYIDAHIVADTETNSLLLTGSAHAKADMTALIHRLDAKSAQNNTHAARVMPLNYLQAKDLAPLLQKMFASSKKDHDSINIVAENTTNTLLLNAPVNILQNIVQVVHQLDHKPKQVLVEAVIAEVDQNSASNLGVEWGTVGASTDSGDGASDFNSGSIARFSPGIGMLPHTSIRAVAYALEQHGNSNILATPMISVINNKEAKLSDGKDISTANREYATTVTGNSTDGGVPFNTYDYKKVALSLKVTPQISPNGMVNLKIDQENDSLEPDASANEQNPTINTSNINTYVMVHSGDVLVMGGLIKQDQTGSMTSVPILGHLPIIGNLFKHKTKGREKKDLLVFIRPIILKDAKMSRTITSKKYAYMRQEEYRRDTGTALAETKNGPYLHPFPGSKTPELPSPFAENPAKKAPSKPHKGA